MSANSEALGQGQCERPPCELADILRKHLKDYQRKHRLSYEQRRAVNAIMQCRTAALGGLLKVCTGCGR